MFQEEYYDQDVLDRTVMDKFNLRVCYGFNAGATDQGGVTIVYRKTANWKNTRMVEVSLAYCNPCDSFCKKVGLTLALQRWKDGQTVVVPARDRNGDGMVTYNLLKTFYYNLSY